MNDAEYIEDFLAKLGTALVELPGKNIERVIEILYAAWSKGNRVFLVGNGGSASTASHFAADLNKCTASAGRRGMNAISLVDNLTLISALTNDLGWENVYVEQLKNQFEPGDVLVGLSVHGGSGADQAGAWSQNILKALKYARDNGGITIGLSGFDGGAMKDLTDVSVIVPIDSTPHVESVHAAIHHLIAFRLAQKIK